ARSRRHAAFREELQSLGSLNGHVHFHFDDEQGGRLFDPLRDVHGLFATTHVYCCGPAPLMEAVLRSRGGRSSQFYHFEWFTPRASEVAVDRSFCVVIHSSGKRIDIPVERSILSTLEEHGFNIPYSCREGLCGTCETAVISGIPDHRDSVLTAQQRDANK